ncbi:MAG: SNF2 helicase associated domain-containing protein [Lachnospiraceae bacterium]|nr:SNF2 helicase associated domain-containing protein [Lachnospiraceae bacterium]
MIDSRGGAVWALSVSPAVFRKRLAVGKARREQSIAAMKKSEENYQYFDIGSIMEDLEITKKTMEQGAEYLEAGRITVRSMDIGYYDDLDGLVAQVEAMGKNGEWQFPIRLTFDRDTVMLSACSCLECVHATGYRWYTRMNSKCAYVAAVLQHIQSTLAEKEFGDATDKRGALLLADFQRYHTNQIVANATMQEGSLTLAPRLVRNEGALRLSFKIGSGKLFVIKDLIEFCSQVQNSETVKYGTNTQLNQNINNFSVRSRQWYEFLNKVIQEEEDLINRISEMRYYYYEKKRRCSDFELYGWRLDQFCEMLGEDAVEYEDKTSQKREKRQLICKEGTPNLTMQIRKNKIGKRAEFHGIEVSCDMPDFYVGIATACYIQQDVLYRTDIRIIDKIRPFFNRVGGGQIQFQIGRRKLTDFYYSMLPQLEEVFTVTEENSEEIHSYLPPEVSFVFYLDAQDGDITCRLSACYGEHECAVVASMTSEPSATYFESFRLEGREREIFLLTKQIFPYIDSEHEVFCCNGEEDSIYEVLNNGVERLAEMGEVRCTNAFKRLNVVRKMRVTVGVSVSNGLLDLEIDTENIGREDLLEVLKGYKLHKKYYRLKNGDFVNLEDENLQMLRELMDTMHLPPKDFVKGKMHLPVYRTLYLDKLLEEKEGVYTSRDHTFREMVKNFKTISDADYEVPDSLRRVMRSYQKNGFKWLKTLESCQFGGILADDMGLGKTIQAISFLLSQKKEGVTSLVVAPASLVFNWGEEFVRFGPQLKVQLVTGDQQERQKKIEQYADYDVSVTSYDLLRRDIACYEGKKFTYEIIDEAQYIKNHTTAAAKSVKIIDSQMRIALTGTPIENRLSELWSIFDFLMPGFLYSYEVFRKELETPAVKYGDKEAMTRIQRMVGPFIMRRLKTDVLKDLPDKLEEVRYVKFDKQQQTVYDAQVVHMKEMLTQQSEDEFNKNKIKVLAELTRLRQLCCDPSLCFDNYKGSSAKLDSCIELVQSAVDGGHKMLLFSQFTRMLERIRKRLDEEGISYYVITGETSKEKRLQLVKAFNEDAVPVFLISLKAGGVGLNLTGADVVIHYDPWWNVAAQNQATDRAHRIGQTRKVTVYKLIARHSVEEKILKLQEAKRDLAEQVMNGEMGQLGSMSREELMDLLQG